MPSRILEKRNANDIAEQYDSRIDSDRISHSPLPDRSNDHQPYSGNFRCDIGPRAGGKPRYGPMNAGMSEKFIPNGDLDFAAMAENFARHIAADPARYSVAQIEAEAVSVAVANFRAALNAARGASRSAAATRAKDEARDGAERIVRRLAQVIRANDRIDAASKVLIGLRERPAKVKQQPAPAEPPRLRFLRALHEGNGATPMHELEFGELDKHRIGRPEGAVRLELFVDLILPEEAVPGHPGANHGGRPWYLRSFTRSPIVLAPPMTRAPMRVIYWGRWADSSGNVGPFSATAVAWIEGGSSRFLPGGVGMAVPGLPKEELMLENAAAPAGRERTISVMVLEAQYQSFHPQHLVQPAAQLASMPAREARRIEGPAVEEAA
jgi:hypothetical protein